MKISVIAILIFVISILPWCSSLFTRLEFLISVPGVQTMTMLSRGGVDTYLRLDKFSGFYFQIKENEYESPFSVVRVVKPTVSELILGPGFSFDLDLSQKDCDITIPFWFIFVFIVMVAFVINRWNSGPT